jgi:BASS family bile acid:Na+ symporter
MQDFILPLAIGLIMFGVGTNLRIEDFSRVFRSPKGILVGLVGQILLLPMLAFILAFLMPLQPIYKVGLVLIAACPGGASSNLVTHLFKGRTALSVSLTAFNSFIILLSLPLILGLTMEVFLEQKQQVSISFWYIFTNVFFTVVVPVFLGLIIHHAFPNITNRLQSPLKMIMPFILLFSFGYIIFIQNNNGGSAQLIGQWVLIFPALALNFLAIIMGYLIGKWSRLSSYINVTLAIEVGLQNSALAIYVAYQLLENPPLAMLGILYSSFSFFTTMAGAWWLKKLNF